MAEVERFIRRKPGGPRKREPRDGERVALSLRMTPNLKRRLDTAAEKGGRSQSQEAEFRLERSFEQEALLPEVLTLAFGSKHTAGLVWMIGLVMDAAGKVAQEELVNRQPQRGRRDHWIFDAEAYKEASEAAKHIMRRFELPLPSSDVVKAKAAQRRRSLVQSSVSISSTEIGERMIRQAFEPAAVGSETAEMAAALKKLLGPQIATRFQNLEDFVQGRDTARTIRWSRDPTEEIARAVFDLLNAAPRTPSQDEIASVVRKFFERDPKT